MSALYGRLQGRGKEKTATAHTEISARLESWVSAVSVTMYPNGEYVLTVGEKDAPFGGEEHYRANADEQAQRRS